MYKLQNMQYNTNGYLNENIFCCFVHTSASTLMCFYTVRPPPSFCPRPLYYLRTPKHIAVETQPVLWDVEASLKEDVPLEGTRVIWVKKIYRAAEAGKPSIHKWMHLRCYMTHCIKQYTQCDLDTDNMWPLIIHVAYQYKLIFISKYL